MKSRSPEPTDAADAARHMQRALALARRGLHTTHPNPRVGCVIVRDGKIVGEGFHERAGGPHAEIAALQAAGEGARGADVYVTLEPCCHSGRTGPCTDALVKAGVARVFAAMQDPNPRVAGHGAAALRAAGIPVETGLAQAEAAALNRGFVQRMTQGRPWLTLKLAMSVDGRTAMASGESRWITSDEARADVHRLRAEAGAVLTSANTVLADDPELTVRAFTPLRVPDRIVLDTGLRAGPEAKVWRPGARRIAIALDPARERGAALQQLGVEVVRGRVGADRSLDLPQALSELARLEINEVLAEVGPRLAGRLLEAGLVDEVVVYVAPVLLGDRARPLAELPRIAQISDRIQLAFQDVARVGPDLRLMLRPVRKAS
ncbi:MAG TPA: bifunctional diaminohydroxyphosphoribosylaminopyrimidine deaminase/5-amino-6-(5-phosphoribosylamino)uracil reductase RibD [Candidatus Binatia bacterium]|nr:bifunctional diaminohydroxyphosphoribosylaminopyrimidine deaminase/5-amino-6-(5-phosphoribosylamino)uracil reductase RibD [Candidatus Binatia bacterium]